VEYAVVVKASKQRAVSSMQKEVTFLSFSKDIFLLSPFIRLLLNFLF